MKHPIQPLERDAQGVIRFKPNKIVQHLLDNGGIDLNQLARIEFSQEDREQFAQLIGYSLKGYGELSYVSDESYDAAERMFETGCDEQEARANALRERLEGAQAAMRDGVASLYGIHPNDLTR